MRKWWIILGSFLTVVLMDFLWVFKSAFLTILVWNIFICWFCGVKINLKIFQNYVLYATSHWHIAGIFPCSGTIKWRMLFARLSVWLYKYRGRENKEFNIKTEDKIYYYYLEGTKISLNVACTHNPTISFVKWFWGFDAFFDWT